MKTLIIGGTGVISTAIVDRLAQLGIETFVFNRGLRPVRYQAEVTVLSGDKSKREEFIEAMKNHSFDAVIDMISYNFNDAKITLDAFDADTHFVFTSTCAAYKRPAKGCIITEEHARWDNDEISPYGYHKARMEDFLFEQKGRKVTVIRPSLTYGIGCKNIGVFRNNYGIVERIKQRKPNIVFGDGTNPWDFTFAPDIAKAYAGVLCREKCFGQAYHATSGDVRTWDDLYLEFGKLVGIEPKLLHISTEMLMKAVPEKFLHIEQEKKFCGIFDNSKLKRDVPEYDCEYTLAKTLAAIYDWYLCDPDARVIDRELDVLEDSLVEKYFNWLHLPD